MRKRLLFYCFLLVSIRGFAQCVAPPPNVQGVTVCANNVATLSVLSTANTFEWFDSDTSTTVLGTGNRFTTPVLNQSTTYFVRVTVDSCVSEKVPVTALVNPVTEPPMVPDITICSGSFVTLSANGAGDSFEWFTVPTGGTRLILSPDFTTPVLTTTTTYYVQTTYRGCLSLRVPVVVTVNPIPAPPVTEPVAPICAGSFTLLTATASDGTIQWTNAGGALVGTGPTFTTPILTGTTTYYASTTNGGCSSQRIPATVTVHPTPAAPSASGVIVCNGSPATLTAFAPGGNYEWYDAATGGNLLQSGASFTTVPLTATQTFYVQTSISGCPGPRAPVTVTVNPVTAPPSAADVATCSGSSATLTASGSTGTYAWYDSATGGNLLSSTATYTTPAITSAATYYVETAVAGCVSTRTPVQVSVNPLPIPPLTTDITTCPGTSATLTADAAGTLEWYDAATGGNLLFTGPSFVTPAIIASTTFYVQANNGQCASGRTPLTVSVSTVPNPEFVYPGRVFLTSGPDPKPVIVQPSSGGTFTAPAGLVFTDPATGQIDVSASTPGTYTVTFTNNGPCPQLSTIDITIVTNRGPGFVYDNDPFCQYGVNPLPRFTNGSVPGLFTASPAGLVFTDASTGGIDLTASTPGKYRIRNTFLDGNSSFYDITIKPTPVVNAGPDQIAAMGSSVTLAGAVNLTGTIAWSGGSGTFSNTNVLNPVYTPGPGEVSAKLTLISTAGACTSVPDDVEILFLTDPVVTSTTACYNTTGTLAASGPGEVYQWFDAPVNGNLLQSGGATFTSPPLTTTTRYYVQATVGGVTTHRVTGTVTVASQNAPVLANPVTICYANTATLKVSGASSYKWYDVSSGGSLLSTSDNYTTPILYTNSTYYVEGEANGCSSGRIAVPVTVNPLPRVTSGGSMAICSGNSFTYTLTGDQPGTTFTWSRAAISGINTVKGDADVNNMSSSVISETLISTNTVPTVVTYLVIPMAKGCPGEPFSYRVTVNPVPAAISSATTTICNNTTTNYTVKYNVAGTGFSWSRAAVAGISNAAITGQHANPIREILVNTTALPKTVTYTYTSATSSCAGQIFQYVVTVNPTVGVMSAKTANICSGVAQNYAITSNNPVTTFTWHRDAIAGISNPAISGQTTNTITEVLVNTGRKPIQVSYSIVPSAYGCTGSAFVYRVTVYPQPITPGITSNSPACTGSIIQLSTPPVEGATYLWTGPNAFTSTQQNPVIPGASQANAGAYRLTVTVNGCLSASADATVLVTIPPVAIAGKDQQVCANTDGIALDGNISGGTTTGLWTSSGTGTFSPAATSLKATYIPSSADRALSSLKLTLTSTNNGNCGPASSSLQVTLQPQPVVQAGADQDVCSQTQAVSLNGSISNASAGSWSTTGDGSFLPSNAALQVTYAPGRNDISTGKVTLSLTSATIGSCGPVSDALTVRFIAPPTVNAGIDRLVMKGKQVNLQPSVSDANVQYLWLPNVNLSDNRVKNPLFTAVKDQEYTLTITDSRGCVSSDKIFIKVLDPITIPNTFTPNGDGINDVWNIPNLIEYPAPRVMIYTRYGERVFYTSQYNEPWTGYYKGSPLPMGTYYYVIETNFEEKIYSGSITIVR